MLDVLLPSAYFCDLVFTGIPHLPELGDEVFAEGCEVLPGAGFIPAVALTRLGMKVGWACDFGNDFFSRYVLEQADRQNLSTELFRIHDQPLQAVTVSYSFAGERAFLSYLDPLPPADLTALVRQNPARCLLLMSLHCESGFIETVEVAHAQGSLVFMDGQVANKRNLSDRELAAAIRSIDIFSVNEAEALQLTEEASVASALERLAEFAPTVVIKLGAKGAVASWAGAVVSAPGIRVDAVDTTGAGDNFDCGFLYGILHDYSLDDCLRCGNICGAYSTTAPGGWDAAPSADQLQAYLSDAAV
jgi:sugar/nucleoside kinase (ribokinase family)